MAKIKHIALSTQDVDRTAAFYVNVFGMKSSDLDVMARIPYLIVGGFVGAVVGAAIYALLTSGSRPTAPQA